MEDSERRAIEADCARLMGQFSWYTDTFDYDASVKLFVPDCTFSRAEQVYTGIDGLYAAFSKRAPDRRTCHVLSNVIIDAINHDRARGKAHALVFGYRPCGPDEEVPLGLPDSIVRFEAEFSRRPEGWRIAKWHIALNFRRAIS